MKTMQNKYLLKVCSIMGIASVQEAIKAFVQPYRQGGETLELLARSLGVSEIVEEPLPFEGGIFQGSTGLRIKLNSLSPRRRQRFTLAHEIGHLLLETAPNARRTRNCAVNRDLERACDVIATELLMPAPETISAVHELGAASTENLRNLARRFDVSLHTAARRVRLDLGLWKPSFGLWKWDGRPKEVWFVGKRLWSTREPSFLAFEKAIGASKAVLTREYYSQREYAEAFSLEVLDVGRDCLLGIVA